MHFGNSEHDAVRVRKDLPLRAGHGFFINDKYVSEDDLWRVFGEYTGKTVQSAPVRKDDDVKRFEESHKKLHTIGQRHGTSSTHTVSQNTKAISSQSTHTASQKAEAISSHTAACCMAVTASCLACQHDLSVGDYCKLYPFTSGCEGENVVLHLNDVCYEYCFRGSTINYPDKCSSGLTCAPTGATLEEGGGCGMRAYTCQHKHLYTPEHIDTHHAHIADHMMTNFILGDDWLDDEMAVLYEEMDVCEKIEYKVKMQPSTCNLQHKFLYKKRGCCVEKNPPATEEPIVYVMVGAGACCLCMTFAAVAGCAEMQRRKANRLERRMGRLMNRDGDMEMLSGFLEEKQRRQIAFDVRQKRYDTLYAELHNSKIRYPLLLHEVL